MTDDGRSFVALVGRFEKALRDELLQVEGGQLHRDADLVGHLGAGHRAASGPHRYIGRPPRGVVQHAQPDDRLVEVAAHTATNTTSPCARSGSPSARDRPDGRVVDVARMSRIGRGGVTSASKMSRCRCSVTRVCTEHETDMASTDRRTPPPADGTAPLSTLATIRAALDARLLVGTAAAAAHLRLDDRHLRRDRRTAARRPYAPGPARRQRPGRRR